MSFRDYLNSLKSSSLLVEINEKISLEGEVTEHLQTHDGKAVIFNNIIESQFPLVGNLLSSREQLKFILSGDKKFHDSFRDALLNPLNPEICVQSLTFENAFSSNLLSLPIPKFFEQEGGRYLTSGIIFSNFPGTDNPNLSIHRIMILDNQRGAIRLVPRDLHNIFNHNCEKGVDTPIAIVVGYHPALALAASSPLIKGETELNIANSLLGGNLEVVRTPKYSIKVPTDVEFILEGKILADQTISEGPYVDITGTLDEKREQPIVEIEQIYHRDNPIFQTILAAHNEHHILMGFPREVKIYSKVASFISEVHDVYLTPEGSGWLSANISISTEKENDSKRAAKAAFEAHPSLKWCTIVDEDIDVWNREAVEWARITRAGEGDIKIINKVRGSSLDPSKNLDDKTSIRVIIDATKKKDRDQVGYEKVI
jgi:UbiD family decarboxylase